MTHRVNILKTAAISNIPRRLTCPLKNVLQSGLPLSTNVNNKRRIPLAIRSTTRRVENRRLTTINRHQSDNGRLSKDGLGNLTRNNNNRKTFMNAGNVNSMVRTHVTNLTIRIGTNLFNRTRTKRVLRRNITPRPNARVRRMKITKNQGDTKGVRHAITTNLITLSMPATRIRTTTAIRENAFNSSILLRTRNNNGRLRRQTKLVNINSNLITPLRLANDK